MESCHSLPIVNVNELKEVVESQAPKPKKRQEIDTVLDMIGWGRYQWVLSIKLIIISAPWALLSSCISLVIPSIDCDSPMTATEKGWMNAIIFAGMLIGCICSPAADVVGRRKVLIGVFSFGIVSQLICGITRIYAVVLTGRFLTGISVALMLPTCFAYTAEYAPPKHRARLLSVMSGSWVLGTIYASAAGWLIIPKHSWSLDIEVIGISRWQVYLISCTLPLVAALCCVLTMSETPKMMVKQGREEAVINLFRRISRHNSRDAEQILEDTQIFCASSVGVNNLGDKPYDALNALEKKTPLRAVQTTLRLLRSRKYRYKVLLACFARFCWNGLYQSFTLWIPELMKIMSDNSKYKNPSICQQKHGQSTYYTTNSSISSNDNDTILESPSNSRFCSEDSGSEVSTVYINIFIASSPYVVGVIICFISLKFFRRRYVAVVAMLLTSLVIISLAFVNRSWQVVLIGCLFNVCVGVGSSSFDALVPEVIPTAIRSTTIGLAVGFSRVGILIGVLLFRILFDYHCTIPIFLLCGYGATSAALVFFLRDYHEEKKKMVFLPDTEADIY